MKINMIIDYLKWNLLGNIVFAFSQWIIVVMLTKFGGIQDLGSYSYALALISPIMLFFSFDLRRVLATENKDIFNKFFFTRIINMLLATAIVMLISIIFKNDYFILLIILSLCVYKIFEYISDILFGYMQQKNKMDFIGKSQFYRGILNTLFFGLTYFCSQNLLWAINAMNISMILVLMFFDWRFLSEFKIKEFSITYEDYKKLIMNNLSLAISLLIVSLIVNIPKLYLENLYDKKVLGYFTGIYYIITIANILINPLLTVLSNKFREEYNKSLDNLLKLLYKLITFSTVICLFPIFMISISGELILKLLYNKDFADYNSSFIVLSISIVFSLINGILSLAMITMRKNKSQLVINVVNFTVSIFLGYFLILKFSILGAAFTILINRIMTSILLYLNIEKNKLKGFKIWI